MNQQEANEFFDLEVKSRFHKWNPTEKLILDWVSWIKCFDYGVAEEAIKQHLFDSVFAAPILNKFYSYAKKQQNKDIPGRRHQLPNDWTKYKIVCTEGKRKGFEKTAALRKELIGNDNAEKVEAEKLKEYFKNRDDGEWHVEKLDKRPDEEYSEETGIDDELPF